MSDQNKSIPRVRPAALTLLAVALLLVAAVACRSGDDATPTPSFSLPTALPSPEAVPADGGSREATAARTSDYWAGPKTWEPEDVGSLERVTQELVAPPFLPEHEQVNTGEPRVVEVRMVVEEKEIEVAPGAFMWAYTFNGSVPGPIIVVHEGDYVELTLVNPSENELLHNIDFHASVGAHWAAVRADPRGAGAGGGAAVQGGEARRVSCITARPAGPWCPGTLPTG